MSLKSVDKTKIKPIDYNKEKYFMTIEGYSLLSNIGFVKIEIGYGISQNDAFFVL